MSLSTHVNNKTKNILIFVQGLDDRTLTSEMMYLINFTVSHKKFCLSLHYNGANSYLFVNATEIIKFKPKDSEIVSNPLCLGKLSEHFSLGNMEETGLYGLVYYFSVDYDAIAVDYILDINKYLVKKNNVKRCLDLLRKFFVAMSFFSANALECVSMNNQECKIRTKIIDINNNEPTFYPFSISLNKCIKINAVKIVTILRIHVLNCVFLMLLKT